MMTEGQLVRMRITYQELHDDGTPVGGTHVHDTLWSAAKWEAMCDSKDFATWRDDSARKSIGAELYGHARKRVRIVDVKPWDTQS